MEVISSHPSLRLVVNDRRRLDLVGFWFYKTPESRLHCGSGFLYYNKSHKGKRGDGKEMETQLHLHPPRHHVEAEVNGTHQFSSNEI